MPQRDVGREVQPWMCSRLQVASKGGVESCGGPGAGVSAHVKKIDRRGDAAPLAAWRGSFVI